MRSGASKVLSKVALEVLVDSKLARLDTVHTEHKFLSILAL